MMNSRGTGASSGRIRRNQDGSLDGRQTSPQRGGRGEDKFFTSPEAKRRHDEGSRRGGMNSHKYDGTARTTSGRRGAQGRSSGSFQGRSSSRGNYSGNQGQGQNWQHQDQNIDQGTVDQILDAYNPETQDMLREYFRNEVYDQAYEEARGDVLNELRGTLDDLEQEDEGQWDQGRYDDQED